MWSLWKQLQQESPDITATVDMVVSRWVEIIFLKPCACIKWILWINDILGTIIIWVHYKFSCFLLCAEGCPLLEVQNVLEL